MKNYNKYLLIASFPLVILGILLFIVNNVWTVSSVIITSVGAGILLFNLVVKRQMAFAFLGKRSTKYGLNAIIVSFVVLGILVLINFTLFRHSWRIDTTSSGQFSLAEQTVNLLEALDTDVKVYAFQKKLEAGSIEDFLKEYSYHSSSFDYEVIDPDENPELAKSLGVRKYGELVVQSGSREERIQSPSEEGLTNAIIKVTSTKTHKIYILSGHGEKSFELSVDERDSYSLVAGEFSKINYQTESLVLYNQLPVPDDASLVIVAGPKKTLLPTEVEALKFFLESGGSLFILLEPQVNDEGLENMLADLGVLVQNDIVVEQSASFIISGGGLKRNTRVSIEPTAATYGRHRITKNFRLTTAFPTARSLKIDSENKPAEYNLVELFSTSLSSWGETDFQAFQKNEVGFDKNTDNAGPLVLGIVGSVKEEFDVGRFIVVGDSEFASNPYLARASGNKDLFLNMVSWLLEDEELISIRPKDPQDRRIEMSLKQTSVVFWLLVISLPVSILLLGVIIYSKRRR
ncbi:MAG: GldG family protein [Candidatus Marinimicrobia bacterium]|nr:GldG family protein [Candidatus Neomarinimicrobiota bacterium]